MGPGADALYCKYTSKIKDYYENYNCFEIQGALSDVVIAYQKVYRVPNLCKESDFVAKVIPGYQKDWIRFGYFQLTHEEDIKPYQQVVVQKKVNVLHVHCMHAHTLYFHRVMS